MVSSIVTSNLASIIEVDVDSFDWRRGEFLLSLCDEISRFLENQESLREVFFRIEQLEVGSLWAVNLYSNLEPNLTVMLAGQMEKNLSIKCSVKWGLQPDSAEPYIGWNKDEGTINHLQSSLANVLIDGSDVLLTERYISYLRRASKRGELQKYKLDEIGSRRAPSRASIGQLIADIELLYDLPEGSVRLYAPYNYEMDSSQKVGLLREAWGVF